MTEHETKQLMTNIEKLVDKRVKEQLGNALFVKPAVVTSVASGGTKASVQLIGDPSALTNIEVYSSRTISVGDNCFVVYWGANGTRMSNIALLFGGNNFR